MITQERFKRKFGIYIVIGWFSLLLFLPIVIAYSPTIVGAYMRLAFSLFIGLICVTLLSYMLFAPTNKYFKRAVVTRGLTNKQKIFVIVIRTVSLPMLVAAFIYVLLPFLIGSYHLLILRQPFEVISDTVVYVQSQSKGVTNNETCSFITCGFKLSSEPNRSLDAIYSNVRLGNRYKIYILPGTNIVLASTLLN